MRSQYFDFTVQAGTQHQRVQFEADTSSARCDSRVRVGNEPLAINFIPRSKWVVNAILAWTAPDAAHVEKDIITPFEEWTYRMPSAEWATVEGRTGA